MSSQTVTLMSDIDLYTIITDYPSITVGELHLETGLDHDYLSQQLNKLIAAGRIVKNIPSGQQPLRFTAVDAEEIILREQAKFAEQQTRTATAERERIGIREKRARSAEQRLEKARATAAAKLEQENIKRMALLAKQARLRQQVEEQVALLRELQQGGASYTRIGLVKERLKGLRSKIVRIERKFQ
jgi:hypothetical protein